MKKMLCHTPISIKENIYPILERINVLSINRYNTYFISAVIGLLTPFIETRKALAEPNFKCISRRIGT